MPRKTEDPRRICVQGVTATPMDDRGEQEGGRLYWRARTARPERRPVWSGWGTRAEAEAAIIEALRRPETGRRRRPASSAVVATADDLLVAWAAHMAKRHDGGAITAGSLGSAQRSVGYLREVVGAVPVWDLSVAHVEDAVATWMADGAAPRTVVLVLRHLRAAIRWGFRRGLCADVETREAVPEVRDDEFVLYGGIPSRSDVELTIEAMCRGPVRDALEILSFTGARTGEVAALLVGDYDPAAGTLRLSGRDERRGHRGKVAARTWPVQPELRALLERLSAGRPASEPLLDLPFHVTSSLHTALTRATDLAGVDRFSPHGVRRLVVTELLERNNPKTVSKLTGHTVEVLLRFYVRPDAGELRAAVGRVAWRGKVRRLRRRA